MYRGLALRQRKRSLFDLGRYEPCEVHGPHADQVIAFCPTGLEVKAVFKKFLDSFKFLPEEK